MIKQGWWCVLCFVSNSSGLLTFPLCQGAKKTIASFEERLGALKEVRKAEQEERKVEQQARKAEQQARKAEQEVRKAEQEQAKEKEAVILQWEICDRLMQGMQAILIASLVGWLLCFSDLHGLWGWVWVAFSGPIANLYPRGGYGGFWGGV